MTKTESLRAAIKTMAIETCQEWLQCEMSEGVRAAIPNTKNLIMVGAPDWIAKHVPGVEAMVEGALTDELAKARRVMFKAYCDCYMDQSMTPDEIADKLLGSRLAATTQASTAQADVLDLAAQLRRAHRVEIWDWDHLLNAASMLEKLAATSSTDAQAAAEVRDAAPVEPERDPLYEKAVQIVRAHHRVSVSLVQRHLFIGYNRAARLIEAMEADGIVSACNDKGHRTLIERAGDTGEQADGGATDE